MTGHPISRRRLLEAGGTAIAIGLAGCSADPLETNDGTSGGDGARTGTPGRNGSDGDASGLNDANEVDAEQLSSPYASVYEETIGSVVMVDTAQGQGTGFVFDDGYVVTNAHVVGTATAADVRFSEGRWSDGDVVGADPHSDLAAIAVEDVPSAVDPLAFAESDATVGQEVVAIGNPFSLSGTVTAGIVSGIDRSIPAPTGFSIPDAIQTDAAVNPGNSGGPLVDLGGRVIAVVNSGGGDNIAFGVSAALARRVLPELVETGTYDHSYVGASFDTVTPAVATANDLDEPRGLLVVDVVVGGPADGVLRPSDGTATVSGSRVRVGGDVVLSIDGAELATSEDLGSHLSLQTRPGDSVPMTILRDGAERTVELELGTRPDRP